MSSIIEVKNFTKIYGDFIAVDNISFEVEDDQQLPTHELIHADSFCFHKTDVGQHKTLQTAPS